MSKFLCICLSSTIQKTVLFDDVVLENVNRSKSYRIDASGKAINSARVLNQLENNSTYVVCPIGKKNKNIFLELAKNDKLKIDYVLIPGFTRECVTLLSTKKNTTTELVVSEPQVLQKFDFEKAQRRIFKLIKKSINKVDGVLFAGSRPECWSSSLIVQIAKLAIDNKKIFLADYHSKDLILTLKNIVPTIVKINSDEFISTFNLDKTITEDNLKQEIINASKKYNNIFIITRGEKSTFAANCSSFVEVPVPKIIPLNTIACGDSFSAGFLYEYVKTKDFEKSLLKATECATLNAQKLIPGTIL